jgi:FMN phosphatase YigB (HAD superfamily)
VPTAPAPRSADIALLFDFDGTLYVGDLPILSHARHCADQLSVADAITLIDNLRLFLEGKSVGDRFVDLTTARDGLEAVEILGAAAGLSIEQIGDAYRSSRRDLAASAFAMDAPAGLLELLTELPGAYVLVVTNADPTGVQDVIDSIELAPYVDQLITAAGKPDSMPAVIGAALQRIAAPGRPERLMVVGDRWDTDLTDAHRLGAATALVDRFGRGEGTPTLRAADLAGLVPGIRDWAERVR